MKKFLVAIVILGVIAGGVAWAMTNTPERQLCVKMGELCGVEGDLGDLEQCVEQIEELEKVVGKEPIESASECVAEADTCVEGTGCMYGAGYKAMPKLMNEFFKGFERAK